MEAPFASLFTAPEKIDELIISQTVHVRGTAFHTNFCIADFSKRSE
jgi:hypothetical protein